MKPYTSKIAASSVTVGTAIWNNGLFYANSVRQEWHKAQYLGCWINGVWFEPGTFVEVVVGASTK